MNQHASPKRMQQPRPCWSRLFAFCLSLSGAIAVGTQDSVAQTALNAQGPERLEFNRLIAHWDAYGDREAYLSFVSDAQPQIVQVGCYGAHFYGLAPTEHGAGYPAHFPVRGINECGDWFEQLNRELHARDAKVIGHMNVKFLVGDPESEEGPRGFFKFYNELWDEKQLGPKPTADVLSLLEKDAARKPIVNNSYSIGGMREYWACLNNPDWRAVLKAWTKRGIERGVDGYIANYFYRHDCLCEHCVAGFKGHLREQYSPDELREKFAIENLEQHQFTEIVGWHPPSESTPLRREMLKFSQIANKRAFDEVFVEYGRKLKPGLIVAQWNHLGDFNQINGDERCLLPSSLWGADEDYLWYSTGDAANSTDLEAGFLGDATLQARYIRGAFDDKPFTLGKYEGTRIRTAIAELAANGGAPMGFYTRFTDPLARAEIVRYYQFLKRYDAIYHANRPHAEVLLLFPRSRVHAGDVAAVERFKQIGKQLLDAHVLFDVRPDDLAENDVTAEYARVIDPDKETSVGDLPPDRSVFKAPSTVRISASRPSEFGLSESQRAARPLHLHLVNYSRTEPGKRSPGNGIVDERPIATPEITCELLLPTGVDRVQLKFLTPEQPNALPLSAEVSGGRAISACHRSSSTALWN